MKPTKKIIFLLFIELFFSQSLYAKEALKIVYSEQGAPWAWQQQDTYHGLLVDIANEALSNRMNLNISHHFMPWKRAQNSVSIGSMDAMITNFTKSRALYTVASNELITNIRRSLFVRKNSSVISRLKDVQYLHQLKDYSLGNYTGNGWAEKNLANMNVTWANNSTNALRMLAHKRFDIYIANPISTRFKIKALEIPNIIVLPNQILDIKASKFRLLIRQDSEFTEILPEFDKTIRGMKEDNSLQKIFNKYQ